MMLINGIEDRRKKKEFPSHTWAGFYLYLYLSKKGVLCHKCANENIESCLNPKNELFIYYDINWGEKFLYCDHCGKKIEPSYGGL